MTAAVLRYTPGNALATALDMFTAAEGGVGVRAAGKKHAALIGAALLLLGDVLHCAL
jgi:hypothetical protein